MKKIYLAVRENYDNWVVTAMRKRNSERFIFSQMPERDLKGEKGHFELDFEYAPKGEYVGEMKRQGSKPLHIYETSLQELKELAEIEKHAIERMAKKAEEASKESEEYFQKKIMPVLKKKTWQEGRVANMYKKLGLCQGRHKIEGITKYIFPQEVNPLDLKGLSETVHKVLADCTTLDLYVTGLTVALVEVINYAIGNNISVTLYHYNRDTGKYFPQRLLSDIWRDELIEGGYF